MGRYLAEQTVKRMIQANLAVKGGDIIVLGLTFKEDCSDLRNSRVVDVIGELQSYGATVHVHDPVADPEHAFHEYGIHLTPWEKLPRAGAIVAAVAHREFSMRSVGDYVAKLLPTGIFIDVKGKADTTGLRAHGVPTWRL
jgi:UDP-N-acetyl-D-galactosamine dehydrogenase